jgi:Arylsulfotransferase (ASST)
MEATGRKFVRLTAGGASKPLPAEIVLVRGGRPGSEYDDGKMDAPHLVEMTINGQIAWKWRSWEHLDPEKDAITAVQDDRDVWTVANSVSEMPDGNLLVSFRDIRYRPSQFPSNRE